MIAGLNLSGFWQPRIVLVGRVVQVWPGRCCYGSHVVFGQVVLCWAVQVDISLVVDGQINCMSAGSVAGWLKNRWQCRWLHYWNMSSGSSVLDSSMAGKWDIQYAWLDICMSDRPMTMTESNALNDLLGMSTKSGCCVWHSGLSQLWLGMSSSVLPKRSMCTTRDTLRGYIGKCNHSKCIECRRTDKEHE